MLTAACSISLRSRIVLNISISKERQEVKKDEIVSYFGGETGRAVRNIPADIFENIREVRLRANRPASVWVNNSIRYIDGNGQLVCRPESAVNVSAEDVKRTFEAVCQYSVHSFQREIAVGFITLRGGHRVGICGTDISGSVKNVGSLNFRIAREVRGCSDELCGNVFGNGLCNLLIAGAPMTGKTTVLRDISRNLGKYFKTALIDERGELAAVWNGVPQNDIGLNTDVFDGYDKFRGIMTAIRVMSPQVIICDEIGNDLEALRAAALSGVYIAATVHAASLDELERKGIDRNIFDCAVLLTGDGKVSEIRKGAEKRHA